MCIARHQVLGVIIFGLYVRSKYLRFTCLEENQDVILSKTIETTDLRQCNNSFSRRFRIQEKQARLMVMKSSFVTRSKVVLNIRHQLERRSCLFLFVYLKNLGKTETGFKAQVRRNLKLEVCKRHFHGGLFLSCAARVHCVKFQFCESSSKQIWIVNNAARLTAPEKWGHRNMADESLPVELTRAVPCLLYVFDSQARLQ